MNYGMDDKRIRELAQSIASGIGKMLRQEYLQVDGAWCLVTLGRVVRQLRPDEVEWHVQRNHAPFVEGGICPEHPDWWKDIPDQKLDSLGADEVSIQQQT